MTKKLKKNTKVRFLLDGEELKGTIVQLSMDGKTVIVEYGKYKKRKMMIPIEKVTRE